MLFHVEQLYKIHFKKIMEDSNRRFFVKDHAVTKEEFELQYHKDLDLLETTPRPKADQLDRYYESEDYISHTQTTRNIIELGYRLIRKITLRTKLKLINSFTLDGKRLLDVGCGTGDFISKAQRNNWDAIGIEPNFKARQIANAKTNNKVLAPDKLKDLQDQSFDVITLWHVLEHLPDTDREIQILSEKLKPNGILVLALPNFKSFDASHYKQFWAAYDVPRHLWHFSRSSINKIAIRHHLKIIKTAPLLFDAFYVSLLSEKYKRGSNNFLKAFLIGLRSNYKAMKTLEYSSIIYILQKNKQK